MAAQTTAKAPALPFPVVAIGASAGGLTAFRRLLATLPPDSGLALVFVQHLSPDHPSALVEILSKDAPMAVVDAADGMQLRADRLHVLPPNKVLTVVDGSLGLTPRGNDPGPAHSIDDFFTSLAADQGPNAIGVVLSGTGDDGTQGLLAIAAAGGTTFAQLPSSAERYEMPQSAIRAGAATVVATPEDIARRLVQLAATPGTTDDEGDEEADPLESDVAAGLDAAVAILRDVTGVDLAGYREPTLVRRILRRMRTQECATMAEYVALLGRDSGEVRAFLDDALIGVTSFFRNPAALDLLQRGVLSKLVERATAEQQIRCWVVGCSTGQEAYSLAMSLVETAETRGVALHARIFASDLDEAALATARRGMYPPSIETEMSPKRLARFFTLADAGYRIDPTVRSMVTFAHHDVTRDPPFVGVDLVSCRNVLIYMAAPLRRATVATLHYALKPGGTLVLGGSEGISGFDDAFAVLDANARIYKRLHAPARPLRVAPGPLTTSTGALPPPRAATRPDWSDEITRVLLGRYAPAAVLVTADLEVAFLHGRTEPYLRPPEGRPTFKLVSIARGDLFLDINSAVGQARRQDGPVTRAAAVDGKAVDLGVIPLRLPGVADATFLVTFDEPTGRDAEGRSLDATPAGGRRGLLGRLARALALRTNDAESVRLRTVVASEKERAEALLQDYRAALERLELSNESVLSANEGLQSALEEMQTLKEEVDSSNEELVTLNGELRAANEALGVLNDDLANLLSSVDVAIVMVSSDRRIRRFTPAAAGVLGLGAGDVGRVIETAGVVARVADLAPLVRAAIESGTVSRDEVQAANGRRCALTVSPYASSDGATDGAVVVLHDIDALKAAAVALDRVNRDLARFAHVAAHDLVAPLRNVLQQIETLREALAKKDAERVAAIIAGIERSATHGATLVTALLDLHALGGRVLRRESVALPAFVSQLVASIGLLPGQHVDVDVRLPTALGDPELLRQIFQNLIQNGLKFNRSAERHVGVAWRPDWPGGPAILVHDNGIGIAPQHHAQVLRGLERLEGNEFEGVGVGLGLVVRAAERMDWRVSLDPAPTQGATFVLHPPVDSLTLNAGAQGIGPATTRRGSAE